MNEMEVSLNRPTIFSYTQYGDYLIDMKEFLKQNQKPMSFSELGEAIGPISRTKAKKIFRGESPMSKNVLEKIATLLHLTTIEIQFLDLLRKYSHTKDADTAVELFKKITDFKKKHVEKNKTLELTDKQFILLEDWFYIPILQYIDLKNASATPIGIVQAFKGKLTLDQVEQGINKLKEAGLLAITANGTLKKSFEIMTLLDGLPRPLVKKYHKMMIEKALDSIYGMPMDKRAVMSTTINIRQEMVPEIKQKISQFILKLNEDYTVPDANAIYQVNLQIFNILSLQKEGTVTKAPVKET